MILILWVDASPVPMEPVYTVLPILTAFGVAVLKWMDSLPRRAVWWILMKYIHTWEALVPQRIGLNVTLRPSSATWKATYSQVPSMELSLRDVVSKGFSLRDEPVKRQTPVQVSDSAMMNSPSLQVFSRQFIVKLSP